MAGNVIGTIKRQTGFGKPGYKPGSMIQKMNLTKYKKSKHKEHSAESIKGMREFVDEEAKEKGRGMKHKMAGGFNCKVCGMKHESMSHPHYKKHLMHMKKAHHKIKKTGKSFGKSNRLGGGGRFAQVKHAVAGKKGVYNPAGLAAYIGRRSLGAGKMAQLAARGRARAKKG